MSSEIVIPSFDDEEEGPSFLASSSAFSNPFQPNGLHSRTNSASNQPPFSTRPRQDSDVLSRPYLPRKGSFANPLPSSHSRTRSGPPGKNKSFSGSLPFYDQGSSASLSSHPNASSASLASQSHSVRKDSIGQTAPDTANGPIEQALFVVLDAFFEKAEDKLVEALSRPVDQDLYLPRILAEGVDPSFDKLLSLIALVSKKIPRTVVDIIMRWRKSQGEGVDPQAVQRSMNFAPVSMTSKSVADILSERKALASIYILCRTLTAVVEAASRDNLGDDLGSKLEDIIFNSLKNADPFLVEKSANRRANMDLYARLIGSLSAIRFVSITDRFISELQPVLAVSMAKEIEPRLEMVIRGMRCIKIQIFPMETFEDAIEFVEALSNLFHACSGSRLKIALAITLTEILSPVAIAATAEVNHPAWAKAMNVIYTKALQMSTRPRYLPYALPLMCTALGASTEESLLANLNVCIDMCLPRLKEKATRPTAYYGVLELIWAYLRRCHETHTNVAKRLDVLVKTIFPVGKRSLHPPELSPDLAAYLPHLISSRHLEFGSELTSTLLNPSPQISSERWPIELLNPERMYTAIYSLLLTFDTLEQAREPHLPPRPPLEEGIQPDPFEPPVVRAGALPEAIANRTGIKSMLESATTTIAKIAMSCERASESFSLLDDRNVMSRNQAYPANAPELQTHIVKRHGAFMTSYPREKQPIFDLLRICLDSWPRLLPRQQLLDFRPIEILLRCLLHVDVDVYMSARRCLERMILYKDGHNVLKNLSRFIARPELVVRETGSLQGPNIVKLESLVGMWSDVTRIYLEELQNLAKASTVTTARRLPSALEDKAGVILDDVDPRTVWPVLNELEAVAVVHLCAQSVTIRRHAIEALRTTRSLQKCIAKWSDAVNGTPLPSTDVRVIDVLETSAISLLDDLDQDSMNAAEINRARWWSKATAAEILPKLIESDNLLDLVLWHQIYPGVLLACQDQVTNTMTLARPFFAARLLKAYPFASTAASLVSNKVPSTPSTVRNGLISPTHAYDTAFLADHWKTHLMALCAITVNSSSASPVVINGPESRQAQEVERLQTGPDIVRLAVPFLVSDSTPFREAVVRGLGCSNITIYKALLEGLNSIVRHLMDEHRLKHERNERNVPRRSARHGRLHQAVARVQELTSKLLRTPGVGDLELSLVAQYLGDALRFVRDPDAAEDASSVAMRRALSVCTLNFVEHCAQDKSIRQHLSTEVRHGFYALFDSWSFRPLSIASPDVSRHGSKSSDVASHHRSKSRGSSFGSQTSNSAYDVFLPAVNANVALCASNAITLKRDHSDRAGVLEAQDILRWAQALFESASSAGHAAARRAVGGLIAHNLDNRLFLDAGVYQCFSEPDNLPLAQSTFSVLSGAIIAESVISVKPSTAICLALWKLGNSDLPTRQRALDMIATRVSPEARATAVGPNQAAIYNTFSGAVLQARLQLSNLAASSGLADARAVFLELAIRILQIGSKQTRMIMQLLPSWMRLMSFPAALSSSQTASTDPVLANLFLLSAKYSDVYQIEIRGMWTALASAHQIGNLPVVISFLVNEASVRGSKEFTRHSQRIIGCLSEAEQASAILTQLSDLVQPNTLVLASDSVATLAQGKLSTRRTNLDTLFPINPKRLPMSPAQAALLLVGDAVLERLHTADPNIIRILHILMMHVDHATSFIRSQARDIIVRILTLLQKLGKIEPGGESTATAATFAGPAEVLWTWRAFWESSDIQINTDSSTAYRNMQTLIADAIEGLERRLPDAKRLWSLVALEWGIACPLRHIACRSLQALRLLAGPLTESMLADLLSRLSSTICDVSVDSQLFAQEILRLFGTTIEHTSSILTALPQLWWAILAGVRTPNEREFTQVIELLGDLVENLTQDPAAIEAVAQCRPENLSFPHQATLAVLRGYRSMSTVDAVWRLVVIMPTMTAIPQIYEPDKIINILFAATLMHGLEAMETGIHTTEFEIHCDNVAAVAASCDQEGMARVMKSLGKNRFRTKDDLTRQAMSALREYCQEGDRVNILVLYLGSLQNAQPWVRKRALSLLKQFLVQVAFTEAELANLGDDLLGPLMQLLSTDLASQALEILDNLPNAFKSAPNVAASSRPSTANSRHPGFNRSNSCFGQAHSTGWSCPTYEQDVEFVRQSLREIAETCGARPQTSAHDSPFAFASEDDGGDITPHLLESKHRNVDKPLEDNAGLGDMVSTLHDLGSWFDDPAETSSPAFRMSQAALSASRVAAVLARSTKPKDLAIDVIPETPTQYSAVFNFGDSLQGTDDHHHMLSSDTEDDASLEYAAHTDGEQEPKWTF